jgi:hypothetical protein
MPEYVEINNKRYKINTDFRIAIKCNELTMDDSIGDLERTLAIIYMLFGDEGIKDATKDDEIFSNLANLSIKYLSCGKEIKEKDNKIDMDFTEDMDYIEASFMSDYQIDLTDKEMHWWKFYNLVCGLSNSELGNCCILNRIRNLRNFDLSQIKDPKEQSKIIKAKEQFALKKKQKEQEIKLTKEQEQSVDDFYKALGF